MNTQTQAEIDRLRAEVAELTKDRQRLDWLYSGQDTGSMALVNIQAGILMDHQYPTPQELRAAIDECMNTPITAGEI